MELLGHQILGLVLLYFLIGYAISIPVVKGVQKEREKDLLRTKKMPSDKFVMWLMVLAWPLAVIMSIFKTKK